MDQSLYGNHGTLLNMDSSDWVASDGKMALDFDGLNDTVRVAIWSGTKAIVATAPLSVSFWYLTRTTAAGSRFAIANSGSSSQRLYLGSSGTTWYCYLNGGLTTPGTIEANKWYHVVATENADAGRFYVNGSLLGSVTGYVGPKAPCFYIGNYNESNSYVDGQIDDVIVWNRTLSVSEIQLLGRRRGIAYERASRRSYYVAAGAQPVENRRNNMLVGCGF